MLSASEIKRQVEVGAITIEPFDVKQLGPNSYDLRLGDSMAKVVSNFHAESINTRGISCTMPESPLDAGGFFLFPGSFYLAHTVEVCGSDEFVPVLHGRSSAARHGLLVHLAAGFGDLGWRGQWVLELRNVTPYPMIVYPGDRVCQVAWEPVQGTIDKLYGSTYQQQRGIVPAKGMGD